MIRYGLLGPAAVWHHGHEAHLGSPQQRVLFGLLLLHRNQTVSLDRMTDVLWPTAVPPNAVAVLRTYVTRLRAGPLAPEALLTRPSGYELRASPGDVDADLLEARLHAGRAEFGRGDAAGAEALLRDGLRLVRGPILPELPDDDAAAAERVRLDEMRTAVAEELVEARLAQGDHHELVPALRAAVLANPLRERGWAQLMVALYRCGRQPEALGAYREAFAALQELGVEPGRQLRDLERMILLQDAALDPPADRVRGVPRYGTSLVGREVEFDALEHAVRTERMVSLVGPAGAGKTRLAAETTRRVGVSLGVRGWWVDLGAVSPGRVMGATSRALAVPQVPGRTPLEGVAARLGDAPGLLVLNNCEHVVEEAATLVSHLLARVPHVRILATSREALRIGQERTFRLAGLPAGAAEQLFADRAEGPVDDADAVTEIVERLDRLPLAIELAAARLRSVSVTELAADLRQRLSLVGDGPRDIPARQRSLEAAIGWSYDLLPPADQRVLRQLSVLAGSFDAEAAAAVAGEEVLPALARLVDASLVAADPPRYRLLMTVRTFARGRLSEHGEEGRARWRHRDAYLSVAESVGRNMSNAGLGPWLARGRLEHENFLAALRWSLDHEDTGSAFALAAWLSWFWFRSGFVRDGRALLEEAMAGADPSDPLWPRALLGRAWLACAAGSADAQAATDDAVAAAVQAGDRVLLSVGLGWRGYELLRRHRPSEAHPDLMRAHAVALSTDDDECIAFADQMLGDLAMAVGDLDRAAALLIRARDRYRRSRVGIDAGFTLVDLARVRLAQSLFSDALTVAGEALTDFRRREDPRGVASALTCVGQAYAGLGQRDRASPALDEAQALVDRWGFALHLLGEGDGSSPVPALRPPAEPSATEPTGATA